MEKILAILSIEKAISSRELAKRLQMNDGNLRKSLDRLARKGCITKDNLQPVRTGSYVTREARVGWRKVEALDEDQRVPGKQS